MDALGRHSWFGAAIVIGVLYCVIGIVFALPSNQVRMWRLAAWVKSVDLGTDINVLAQVDTGKYNSPQLFLRSYSDYLALCFSFIFNCHGVASLNAPSA
jgi:hypothetical protein